MAHSTEKQLSFLKNVLAGAFAGLCEVLAMYPLDVVKTRFQLNTGANLSVIGAFRDIIRTEGFSNLYRGIAAPILAEAPKRAMKFSVNEQYKKWLKDSKGHLSNERAFLAGALAGMTEALINCPFELVKVRMQAKENLQLYKTTLDGAKMIVSTEGPMSLYKGIEAMFWRNGVWNGVYFGTIASIRDLLPQSDSRALNSFLSGTAAGALATAINSPFDVAKSRIQNSKPGTMQHKWAIPTLAYVAKHEGAAALYKGFVPRILRLGPGGGIMLLAFDVAKDILA